MLTNAFFHLRWIPNFGQGAVGIPIGVLTRRKFVSVRTLVSSILQAVPGPTAFNFGWRLIRAWQQYTFIDRSHIPTFIRLTYGIKFVESIAWEPPAWCIAPVAYNCIIAFVITIPIKHAFGIVFHYVRIIRAIDSYNTRIENMKYRNGFWKKDVSYGYK